MKKSILLLSQFFVFLFSFCQQFSVSYSKTAFDKPFTGKVFLYFNKDNREPRSGPTGIESFPCFAIEVKNVQPARLLFLMIKLFPTRPFFLILNGTNIMCKLFGTGILGGRAIAESPGNIYSKAIKVKLTKDLKKVFSIQCTEVMPEKSFTDTKYVKELKIQSSLLSAFHHKPFSIGAAVLLPKSYYDQPQKQYPCDLSCIWIWRGLSFSFRRYNIAGLLDSIEAIIVYLDGNCRLGHSVYANSDNNGPWGDALVKEFIPELEKQYRCDGARLLRGHSSGGWTVLWLQTHYPTVFTACWSSSPDPVDFRDFQKINLYEGDNLYYAKDSSLHMVATVAGSFPWVSMKQDCQMEYVVYRGEANAFF